jgi:hypothetical protein
MCSVVNPFVFSWEGRARLSLLHTLVQPWCSCHTKVWKIWTCWILNPLNIGPHGCLISLCMVQNTCAESLNQFVARSSRAGVTISTKITLFDPFVSGPLPPSRRVFILTTERDPHLISIVYCLIRKWYNSFFLNHEIYHLY